MHDLQELTADELSAVNGGMTDRNALPNPQPNPWARLVSWFAGLFN
jgi:bacteriocin-like protein